MVDELEASGLSIVAFCQRRALSSERVRKWRARFRREAAVMPPRLVELVTHTPEPVVRPPGPVARLAVHCPSGHRIDLGDVELASGLRVVLTILAESGAC